MYGSALSQLEWNADYTIIIISLLLTVAYKAQFLSIIALYNI